MASHNGNFNHGNLALFQFTNLADRAINFDAWGVMPGVVVNTLDGNDTIAASGGGNGIEIHGTLNTGAGNDTITARTNDWTGLDNYGTINTGGGNDTITGIGFCRDISCGAGIDNRVMINTGAGDDIITGSSIANSGTIKTGNGNDVVDFLKGGFRGPGDADFDGPLGKIFLGAGNDTLKGFGSGMFSGGTGKDKLIFGEGIYNIIDNSIKSEYAEHCDSIYLGNGVYKDECQVTFTEMIVNKFEKIGGANGGLFAFKDGTLTVDIAGVGTFA